MSRWLSTGMVFQDPPEHTRVRKHRCSGDARCPGPMPALLNAPLHAAEHVDGLSHQGARIILGGHIRADR